MHKMNIAGTGYGEMGWLAVFGAVDTRNELSMILPASLLNHTLPFSLMYTADTLGMTGSYFVLSMFDRLWHKDLTEDDALALMMKGINEVFAICLSLTEGPGHIFRLIGDS